MKNKGFTLIELLAVIVILAIIALIATPIILGIIDDARNSAKQRTAELVAKEAELAYTSYLFNNGASGKPADFCEYMTDEYFDMDSAKLDATGCNDSSKAEVKVTGDNNVEYTVKYAGGTITVSATGLDDVKTKLASK